MASAEDLIVHSEVADLRQVAQHRGWELEERNSCCLLLGLPARDQTFFYLLVDYTAYRGQPPAWHWSDESAQRLDDQRYTPEGNGFLHQSGRICAPWNRLAYKSVDSGGPHTDWTLANWATNARTGACTTLSAMALRIYVELNGPRYSGRRKA